MIPLLTTLALAGPTDQILEPGRYALTLRVSTLADAPWFPTLRGGSTSHVLVDLTEVGGALVQRGQVCRVDIDGGAIARIEVPDAFLAAQPPREVVATVVDGTYRADLGLDIVGFSGTGALPTSLASTIDWDEDGRPAATIVVHIPAIGAAEMYVVQAAQMVIEGPVTDGGASGRIEVLRFEQATLGARPNWLAAKTQVRVDSKRSGFTLRPLPAQAGCAEVLRLAD